MGQRDAGYPFDRKHSAIARVWKRMPHFPGEPTLTTEEAAAAIASLINARTGTPLSSLKEAQPFQQEPRGASSSKYHRNSHHETWTCTNIC
jgi:hypothetical protein